MRAVAGVLGGIAVLWVSSSVARTLIVPRALRSHLATLTLLCVRLPLMTAARRLRTYERRDAVLAWAAPLSLMTTFLAWLAGYFAGYGLLLYAIGTLSMPGSLREAGSSLFTLGFASDVRTSLTAVDFIAAVTGPVVIGLLIGHLPTLYGAYNRRENEVTLLSSRAGMPAWGPEVLGRYAQVDILNSLPELYQGWERWASDISESHTNYPILIYFRSPVPNASWLTSLLAVLDSAALQLATNPSAPQGEVRLAIRAGFECLRRIAAVERIPFDADPDPDGPLALTYEEFLAGVERLRLYGYQMERSAAEAWPHFRGWRVNYEDVAHRIAWRIDAVPAPWSGPRRRGLGGPEIPVIPPRDRKPTTRR